MSTLDPAGPFAARVADLWWIMLGGSALLALFVWALLWGAFRTSSKRGGARLWIAGLGLAMPVAILSALLVYALLLGGRQLPLPDVDAVAVGAQASRYDWTFTHPGGVRTSGTLHIPAGRPVDVTLTATDVIHAFWVPRLGGKMDAIPGHTNRLRLIADTPGSYRGECAEYCGPGHRNHGFMVIAHDAAGWAEFTGGAR